MRLKDAPIGARVYLSLLQSDYAIRNSRDMPCKVVATIIDNTGGIITIGFRAYERMTKAPVKASGDHSKIDPLCTYVDLIEPKTLCRPAYNRRFLCD